MGAAAITPAAPSAAPRRYALSIENLSGRKRTFYPLHLQVLELAW